MSDFTQQFETLYKRDSKGKVRVWWMEINRVTEEDSYHRTVSGLSDGKKVISGWNATQPKNDGKANSTTSHTQALAEVEALYTRQKEKGYFENLDDVDTFDTFQPMLAEKYPDALKKKKFDRNKRHFAQPKLDGIRCNVMVYEDNDWIRVEAFSRNAKPIVTVNHILRLIDPILTKNPNLVFDGELYNHQFRDDFNKLSSLIRKTKPTPEDLAEGAEKILYYVYDMFDPSFPEATFEQRSKILKGIVEEINSPFIVFVETIELENETQLDSLYAGWLEEGYEGQMVRNNTPYEQDRTWNLLKRKEFLSDEFPVVRVEEGRGNWSGAVKRFVLRLPNGVEFESGTRGSKDVLKKLLEGPQPDWVTCRYFTPTPDGIPRFGVVTDWGWGERND